MYLEIYFDCLCFVVIIQCVFVKLKTLGNWQPVNLKLSVNWQPVYIKLSEN